MNSYRARPLLTSIALIAGASIGCGSAPQPTTKTLQNTTKTLATVTEKDGQVGTTEPPYFFLELVERVKESEPSTWMPKRATMPEALAALGPDLDHSARFRPERSLFRGSASPFEVQFFHTGWSFRDLVDVDVIDGAGQVHPFPFSAHLFEYERTERPSSGAGLGFSGFRVLFPLNEHSRKDEVLVFQGASYFRSLGRGQVYGLSARALAVDLGGEKTEEFPTFSQFYIQEPAATDDSMWIFGILASARTNGVYAFRVHPADTTTVEVFARVFVTAPVDALGLAPMSSMFLFGEEHPAANDDYRPEVHDSDGMAFLSKDGEHLFRPLRNPARTTHSSFRLDSPRGFGFLQRDRAFAHYQDLELKYQHRPSLWVEPLHDWGPGSLHLLEITTKLESDDNMALTWVPDQVPADGLSLHYRLHFGRSPTPEDRGAKVVATRVGHGPGDSTRFVIDFDGPHDGESPVDASAIRATVDCQGGQLASAPQTVALPSGRIQVRFDITPQAESRDVELRAYLRRERDVLSETWSYLWQPSQ